MRGVITPKYYDEHVARQSKPGVTVVLAELFINCCVKFVGTIPDRMRIEIGGDAGEQMFSILHRVDTQCRWGPMNRLRNRLANFCVDHNNCLVFDMAVPLTRKEMVLEALRAKGFNSIEEFKLHRSLPKNEAATTAASQAAAEVAELQKTMGPTSSASEEVLCPGSEATLYSNHAPAMSQCSTNPNTASAGVEGDTSAKGGDAHAAAKTAEGPDTGFEDYKKITFNHSNLRSWYRVRRFKLPIIKLMALVDSLKGRVKVLQTERAKSNELKGRNLLEDGSIDSQKAIVGDEPLYMQWKLRLKDFVSDAQGECVDDTIWMRAPAEGYTLYTQIEASELSLLAPWRWVKWWREFRSDNAYSLTPEMERQLMEEYQNLFKAVDKDWKPLIFHGAYKTALWEMDYRQLKRFLRLLVSRREKMNLDSFEAVEIEAYPPMHQTRQGTFIKREDFQALERETQGMVGGDIVRDDVMADGLLQDEFDV